MKIIFKICMIFLILGNTIVLRAEDIPTQKELTDKAMAAYAEGNPAECIQYLQKAVELYPDVQATHLNYASLSYQIALEIKRQGGDEEAWKSLSVIAFEEFSTTILMGQDSTEEGVRLMTGHAIFLLGDMWHYLYDEPERALDYFEFANEYSPDSELLQRELKVVRDKVGEDYIPQPLNVYEMEMRGVD